jgi:hypothetical protein
VPPEELESRVGGPGVVPGWLPAALSLRRHNEVLPPVEGQP